MISTINNQEVRADEVSVMGRAGKRGWGWGRGGKGGKGGELTSRNNKTTCCIFLDSVYTFQIPTPERSSSSEIPISKLQSFSSRATYPRSKKELDLQIRTSNQRILNSV